MFILIRNSKMCHFLQILQIFEPGNLLLNVKN